MKKLVTILTILAGYQAISQVGINTTTPIPQSSLHVEDANAGVLINKVALTGSDDLTTIPGLTIPAEAVAAEGLMIYNTATAGTGNTAVTPGFYYWNGSMWETVRNSGRNKLGWVNLTDANYTNSLPFVNSPLLTDFSNFSNIDLDFTDDAGDSTIDSYAPTGYTAGDFFDSATSRLTPLELGDSVVVRLQFDATPNQNNGVIVIQLDIGANDIPGDGDDIVIYQKSIPLVRGGSRVTNVSETITLFQLGTFLANGAKLRMAYTRSNNNTGNNCTVDNFSVVVHRISSN